MVSLRKSVQNEVPAFVEFEQREDTAKHIILYSEEKHQREMVKDNVLYLSIYTGDNLAGFIILATEDAYRNVEFRRIVVGTKGRGYGQRAISAMESYCASTFCTKRIWLDVFRSNFRGRHIYAKLGYKEFDSKPHAWGELVLMEKELL